MSTAIDHSGRLVIPKAVRDAAGLRPGMKLEIRFRDGRIEIEPAPVIVVISDASGVAVAATVDPVPTMSAHVVTGVRDRLRDERG